MQQILRFFVRFKVGITFILLFGVALYLTSKAHQFHNDKFISSTHFISSYFFDTKYSITSYLNLKNENKILQEENTILKKNLYNITVYPQPDIQLDSVFSVVPVNIISNSYRKQMNYILINKGENESLQYNYGVCLPNGVLGIIEETNTNYSRVISILNSKLSINAKLKNSYHFGSLEWDGKSPEFMQLKDIPRSAQFSIGDTIVTGGNSLVFPKGIYIGRIENFKLDTNRGYFDINVKLFADMTDLNEAYVIIPKKIVEAKKLLKRDD